MVLPTLHEGGTALAITGCTVQRRLRMLSVRRSDRSSSTAVAKLRSCILSGQDVLFITGAGVSVASGIPPFRDDPSSVWSERTLKYGRKATFQKDPMSWYNDFWLAGVIPWHSFYNAVPNPAHIGIASIATANPRVRVITQNIDMLHSTGVGAIPHQQFVHAHGKAHIYRCEHVDRSGVSSACDAVDVAIDLWDYADEALVRGSAIHPQEPPSRLETVPMCKVCKHGRLRPACTMFDEDYDAETWSTCESWIHNADAIVFVGSSNSVGLTARALASGASRGATLYNFNLTRSSLVHSTATIYHVIGPAQNTIPLLSKAVAQADAEAFPG